MKKFCTRFSLAVVLFSLVCLLVPSHCLADTITLQQGLNGYSGCSDTFIAYGAYPDNMSQNFGPCTELRVTCGHYASW
ncbi:MAG: hypothetical protein C0404_07150 [Verrucomicrobia bacterium]|nr:hypothetical protein [Verrucomicrobiota bacterium]